MQAVLGLIRRFPFIVIIAVLVIGGFIFRDFLAGSAGDLRVGECIDLPSQAEEISEVQHRPCGDPHDAEVFMVLTHSAAREVAYPAAAALESYLVENCLPEFGRYTGIAYEADPDHDVGWFYPTASSWREGGRTFVCYLARIDEAKLTGSRRTAQGTSAP